MNRFKRREVYKPDASSMADVAFLLIVFFLVVSTIDIEKGLGLVLPTNDAYVPISNNNLLHVQINKTEALMDGSRYGLFEIKDYMKERFLNNPQLVLKVSTSEDTPYNSYISILDMARTIGIRKISVGE